MKNTISPKNYVDGANLYLLSSFISFAISIIVLPVYTRLMTPEEYGITIVFVFFGKLIAGFFHFSLHDASYRYYFDYENKLKDFTILNFTNLIFIIVSFSICFIIVSPIAAYFSNNIFDGQLTKKLIDLSIISGFFDYIFLYLMTLLTAQVRAKEHSILTILYYILNSGLSILIMLIFSLTFLGRIYGIIISQVISISILIYLCKNLFYPKLSKKFFLKSMRYAIPFYPLMILGVSQNYLDKTILSSSKGNASLGQYTIGVNFAIILKQIMDAVSKAWNSFFLTKAKENSKISKASIVEKFYLMCILFMTIGLSITYFAEEAIKVLTTKEYHIAIWITPIYIFFYLFAIVGYLTNMQLSIAEKMKYLIPGAMVSAIVNITLNLILIPIYGMIGAAIAASLTSLVTQVFLFYYGMKVFPLEIGRKKLLYLYFLLAIFILPAYFIYALEINFILKIMIKILIIYLFVFLMFKNNFISKIKILEIASNYRNLKKITPLINKIF
tara:strand:+ start:1389 stop:2888 length:1500 start_codon:yes stop_codon:yes gene_type:complete